MTLALTTGHSAPPAEWTDEQNKIVKDYLCRGCSSEEIVLFTIVCKQTGLSPWSRQIYPVKRWDAALKREAMAIQVGIDGYRLIADRTGRYAPGRDASYRYDEAGKLISATAFVMKMTADSTWHEVAATAFFSEYAGFKKDGGVTNMWATKPHIMLAKCAEALALRKAFPAELSGIYTKEEMDQADNPHEEPAIDVKPKIEYITADQHSQLVELIDGDIEYQKKLLNHFNVETMAKLPASKFKACVNSAMQNRTAKLTSNSPNHNKQNAYDDFFEEEVKDAEAN